MPYATMRSRLITEILFACSQEEVKDCVENALQDFSRNKTEDHLIRQFIDTSLEELEGFSPMNKDALQWSNIKIARIYFFRLKQELENVQTRIS